MITLIITSDTSNVFFGIAWILFSIVLTGVLTIVTTRKNTGKNSIDYPHETHEEVDACTGRGGNITLARGFRWYPGEESDRIGIA
jgi:hypothetical protein